jgi:predicted dithiol-disulfide oxidoreductase (DUF899 family)
MELPPIVSEREWQRSHEALLAKEKKATRARDALAAERRRQPMMDFSPDHAFDGREDFQRACGTTEYFALDVFLRDGERVFLTYATTGRGVEALGSVWTFLDLTPFGRQEEWEDTPPGRPQTPPYQWWRPHDEYESSS